MSQPDEPTPAPGTAPGGVTEQLKAERIQEPLAAAILPVLERLTAEIQEGLAAAGPPPTEQLKAERIQEALQSLPDWQLAADGKAIRRTWRVPTLWTGTALASRHATIVESFRHTATFTVTADAVEVALSTPAAGGVTAKDLAVAAALER